MSWSTYSLSELLAGLNWLTLLFFQHGKHSSSYEKVRYAITIWVGLTVIAINQSLCFAVKNKLFWLAQGSWWMITYCTSTHYYCCRQLWQGQLKHPNPTQKLKYPVLCRPLTPAFFKEHVPCMVIQPIHFSRGVYFHFRYTIFLYDIFFSSPTKTKMYILFFLLTTLNSCDLGVYWCLCFP